MRRGFNWQIWEMPHYTHTLPPGMGKCPGNLQRVVEGLLVAIILSLFVSVSSPPNGWGLDCELSCVTWGFAGQEHSSHPPSPCT